MIRKKIGVVGLCISLVAASSMTAYGATKEEVQQRKSNLESQLSNANDQISTMKKEQEEIYKVVEELDGQMTEISNQLADLDTQMTDKQGEIDTTQGELEVAKEDESKQYDDMKKRIRFMYENGNGAYIEILFQAENITDLLNKAEYVSKISVYDRDMLVKYQDTKDAIAEMESNLEVEYAQLDELKTETTEKQASVKELIETKNGEIQNYTASINVTEESASTYRNQIATEDETLRQIAVAEKEAAEKAQREKEEQERQEAARQESEAKKRADAESQSAANKETNKETSKETQETSKPSTPNTGGGNGSGGGSTGGSGGGSTGGSGGGSAVGTGSFIWPVSGTVTSEFGGRDAPTEGASTYHKGIDIAASEGTSIAAADKGTVIVSTYTASTGYYVVISHGNGINTLYMHCSALYAKVGDVVSKGQSIAAVGSTGFSTGPHLHFAVTVNGGYVNPRNYL